MIVYETCIGVNMEFEHIKKCAFERDVSQLNYRVARDGEF